MNANKIFIFLIVTVFSYGFCVKASAGFVASDSIFNCFAGRLNLNNWSRDQVLDRMIECYNLEKNELTRSLLLGVVTRVLDKHKGHFDNLQLEVTGKGMNDSIVVDHIADEIIRAIDKVVKSMRFENKKKEKKKEGWLKKKHLLLLFLGVGVSVTLYFAIKALVGKRVSVSGDVKVKSGITETHDFNVQVGAGLNVIPIDKKVKNPDNLIILNSIANMQNQVRGDVSQVRGDVTQGFKQVNNNVNELSNKVDEGIQFASGGIGVDSMGKKFGDRINSRHRKRLRKLFGSSNPPHNQQPILNKTITFPLIPSFTSTPSFCNP